VTQERLNDLAIIALESRILKKIDYEHIIKKNHFKKHKKNEAIQVKIMEHGYNSNMPHLQCNILYHIFYFCFFSN
jgi:hypothetical protein